MLSKKRGFTIIELSVALAVITTFLIGAMGAFKVTTQFQRIKDNQKRMEIIKISLNSYFARNGRLPFPAKPNLAFNDANFGNESNDVSTFSVKNQGTSDSSIPTSHIVFGAVPVSELGLEPKYAFDAFGNQIMYVVHSHIAAPNNDSSYSEFVGYTKNMYESLQKQPCNKSETACPIDHFYASKLEKDSSNNQYLFPYNLEVVNNRTGETISGTKNKLAYVLVSHGANGSCAYTRGGKEEDIPTTNEKYNCISYWTSGSNYAYSTSSTGTDKPVKIYTGDKNASFDDFVLWQTMENVFTYGMQIDRYASLGKSSTSSMWASLSDSTDGGSGIFFFDENESNVVVGDKDKYNGITSHGKVSGSLNDKFTVIGGSARFLSKQGAIFRWTDMSSSLSNEFAIEPTSDSKLYIKHRTRDSSDNITSSSGLDLIKIDDNKITMRNVLIEGLSNGTNYPLQVSTYNAYASADSSLVWSATEFGVACTSATASTSCSEPVSIMAGNRIVAKSLTLFSDKRVKKDIKQSDSKDDLETIKKLKISDYRFIDGSRKEKKLIAQEVEDVYPMAVQKVSGAIPSVMSFAEIKHDGDFVVLNLPKAKIESGDVLQILCNNKNFNAVVSGAKGGNISIKESDFMCKDGEKVYVYGEVVDDYRTIDYDAISMLNVSATQELISRIEKLEEKIDTENNEKVEENTEFGRSGILEWQFVLLVLFFVSTIFSIHNFVKIREMKAK